MDFEAVRGKVQGPAIALIAFGTLNIFLQLFGICFSVANLAGLLDQVMYELASNGVSIPGGMSGFGGLFFGVIGIVFSAVIIAGGVKLRSVQSYGLCMAGAVLCMLPCGSGSCCCCIIGLIPGIWTIVTLMNDDVKAAFQQGSAPPVGEAW